MNKLSVERLKELLEFYYEYDELVMIKNHIEHVIINNNEYQCDDCKDVNNESLVLNLNDAQNKYFKRFKRVPDKLFLTIEHWNILADGMLESECHKTSFSNIAIEITKCSNSSYFSSNGAGLVVTVKNLGCENRKVKHLFDKE